MGNLLQSTRKQITMTDTTPTSLPVVTKEVAKAKIQLALTTAQLNIQALITKGDGLVLNEDNIDTIKQFLADVKTVQTSITDAHKKGKESAKIECDNWDAAKNDLNALILPVFNKINPKYTSLCQAVETRKRLQKQKEDKEKGIRETINTKILDFTAKITGCKTDSEIVVLEKALGLEKTRSAVYGDLLPELITRIDELRPLITAQKQAMRNLTNLDAAEEKAVEAGDDQKLFEISEKKEEITGQVQEARVRLEEKAISSFSAPASSYTEVFPSVSTSRKTWKKELVDKEAAAKGDLSLLRFELDPNTTATKLKQLIQDGKLKEGETETLTIDGIKYYLDRKY